MRYTLITRTGKAMVFYIESVAKMYQKLNGGFIVASSITLEQITYDEECGIFADE